MSVVVEFELASEGFELGRILELGEGEELRLEAVVPTDERVIPSFWTTGVDPEAFERRVRGHESVGELAALQTRDDSRLYAMKWNPRAEELVGGIRSEGGQLLRAVGRADVWEFEVRFAAHAALSAFESRLREAGLRPTVRRVYTPDETPRTEGYGLTDSQREALTLAVERGYYDVPRSCTAAALGEELGVSDQAVTERLRRGVETLATNTLLPGRDDS